MWWKYNESGRGERIIREQKKKKKNRVTKLTREPVRLFDNRLFCCFVRFRFVLEWTCWKTHEKNEKKKTNVNIHKRTTTLMPTEDICFSLKLVLNAVAIQYRWCVRDKEKYETEMLKRNSRVHRDGWWWCPVERTLIVGPAWIRIECYQWFRWKVSVLFVLHSIILLLLRNEWPLEVNSTRNNQVLVGIAQAIFPSESTNRIIDIDDDR